MTQAAKLLEALGRPGGDWTLAQLQTVAKQHAVKWRHKGGSHCIFIHKDGRTLSVPARRPIKAIYVRLFAALIQGD